ncbi:MAG: chemotaxis protein CheW [Acidobacteriota bacterium]
MDGMDDIVKEFIVESTENLDQLDRDLVELEKDPSSKDLLAEIFRAIHTIKGTTGFLGFQKLEAVAHAGENLLSRLRDGLLLLNQPITSGLLAMVDAVRMMLASIEATGSDGDQDYSALIDTLTRLQNPEAALEVKASPAAPKPKRKRTRKSARSKQEVPPQEAAPNPQPEGEDTSIGQILVQSGRVTEAQLTKALNQQSAGDPRHLGEILVEQGAMPPEGVLEALHSQKDIRSSTLSSNNIRVDVVQLDKLMNLVGELVLARNQILQFSTSQKDSAFLNTTQRLNLITTELQEGVMKARMQPIDNVWNKFPRVVRDLAMSCGKKVRVEMEGKETELDKTIIEAIKDPLTHLVRNSVDHGIETPDKRVAAGKPAEGRLFLRAFHEGGQVNIEISDDGAGINVDRVKRKAVERGLITSEQASRMTAREAENLIFLPGFSTAEKVTNVSGRGVGMDVVKTNIEKTGGMVDVQSTQGLGTTIKVKIPLTLAIIPALTVTSAGERYAIPQISLLELVRLEGNEAVKGIEMIHGAPVYRLRGRLLPLVYLDRALRVDLKKDAPAQGSGRQPTENALGHRSELLALDFDAARNAHRAWRDKIRNFLDGHVDLDAKAAERNDKCVLGQWLYSPSMEQFRYLPEMKQLESSHTELHEQTAKIIRLKNSGDTAGAERELAMLHVMSEHVVSLLNSLQRSISENGAVSIVVLQADGNQFGLIVDEVNDTEEIVVKPLGKHLKGITAFAGATIMGDGKVALILDILGLAHRARVISESHEPVVREGAASCPDFSSEDQETLLLFLARDDGRMAIPLSLVTRLEEFPRTSIERTGDQTVVQYRKSILPLVHVSSLVPERRQKPRQSSASPPSPQSGKVQVVVHSNGGQSIGLIVERILDIVQEDVSNPQPSTREGIKGSLVIQGRVTEILDLEGLISSGAAFGAPQPATLEARS